MCRRNWETATFASWDIQVRVSFLLTLLNLVQVFLTVVNDADGSCLEAFKGAVYFVVDDHTFVVLTLADIVDKGGINVVLISGVRLTLF